MAAGVGGWLADPAAFAESAKGVKFFDEATNKAYFGTADQPGTLYKIVDFAIDIWGGLGRLQTTPKPEEFIADSFVNQ
jgi:NitT/TauT family transport system substrate-binding protein